MKTDPIPVRLDKTLLAKIKKAAKEMDLPLSTTIRYLLNQYFKSKE